MLGHDYFGGEYEDFDVGKEIGKYYLFLVGVLTFMFHIWLSVDKCRRHINPS